MLWLAVLLSLIWFGVVGYAAYSVQQAGQLANIETYIKVCAAVAAALPGLLILMAGFMARSSRRSAEANSLVLEATQRLLLPAQEAGEEGVRFADQMKQSALEVDTAMSRALTAMKTVAVQIGDERMRLESVSYASADNARDLSERMAQERSALEGIARQLREQINEMNQAMPRHSAVMVQTAKDVAAELDAAQAQLQSRIDGMRAAGQSLAQNLADMDGIAQAAAQRTDSLTHAVSNIQEKLDQSRRTVDSAVRASEIAVAAAASTGDKLQDAVSSALEGARQANEEITRNTSRAAENTARTLAELRRASDEATRSLQAASDIARSELSEVPGDRNRLENVVPLDGAREDFSLPAEPPVVKHPPQLMEMSQPSDSPGAKNLHEHLTSEIGRSEFGDDVPLTLDEPLAPITLGEPASDKPQPVQPVAAAQPVAPAPLVNHEDELFERAADALANSANGIHVDEERVSAVNSVDTGKGVGWRDILTDMDKEEHPQLSREEVADELLDRLQDSGIHLPEIFKPKFKRKIASAAQRGEAERRGAIKGLVGFQVDRVYKRMSADRELMNLARQFHAFEEDDALNALQQTARTKRNASPRLAAYLLVDAASMVN